LERSGILDAYEYFLRAICKNGLPEANIFEFAAQQILKYQKKMKVKDARKEELYKSPEKESSEITRSEVGDKSEKLKPKPSVLPFKG